MYTLNDLMSYFEKNFKYSTIKIKEPSKYFYEVFKDVDERNIDLIVRRLNEVKYGFVNSQRNCLDHNFKTISITLNANTDNEVVYHEIGHLIDFIRLDVVKETFRTRTIHSIQKSNDIILSNGKTLNDTIKNELKLKSKEIYEELMVKYNDIRSQVLTEEEIKLYEYHKELYKELKSLQRKICERSCVFPKHEKGSVYNLDLKKFKSVEAAQQAIDRKKEIELEFNEGRMYFKLLRKIEESQLYKDFIYENGAILDSLGSMYDLKVIVPSHTRGYYKTFGAVGSEFFANCFALKICQNNLAIEKTKKYLPESYSMFEELLEKITGIKQTIIS